jgi:hypothetical protein
MKQVNRDNVFKMAFEQTKDQKTGKTWMDSSDRKMRLLKAEFLY